MFSKLCLSIGKQKKNMLNRQNYQTDRKVHVLLNEYEYYKIGWKDFSGNHIWKYPGINAPSHFQEIVM